MFVLLMFYTLDGEVIREELPQPDYKTCLAEKTLWLKHINRRFFQDPEAHCVVKAE